jgi:asparagine synthase (glutamine-hydrolysing)
MCGIYGEFDFIGSIDSKILLKKMDLMKHRGPDGFGFAFGDYKIKINNTYHNHIPDNMLLNKANFFLGHRRLSIIDLNENAFQPMVGTNMGYIIVFNGEIYNYVELKESLIELGYQFVTDHSDTEVLLNAFVEWEEKCLDKLIGMFAFAVYDIENKKVFIARDRIGQKPLYYSISEEKFIFSSEILPILKYVNFKYKLEEKALRQYLIFGHIPTPLTLFEGVQKLPPGYFAWIDLKEKTLAKNEYWKLEIMEDWSKNKKKWTKLVEKTIKDSVKLRMRADVPLGAFCSGGIDSTIIIKAMAELGEGQISTYGADFHEKKHSQRKYMEKVALRFNTNAKINTVGLDEMSNYKEIISVFDEPFDGGSSIAVYKLFKLAKNINKVILTGDGGDELFTGYRRYQKYLYIINFNLFIRKIFGAKVINYLNKIFNKNIKIKKILKPSFKDFIHRYNLKLTRLLINTNNEPNNDDLPDICKELFSQGIIPTIKAIQYMDVKTLLTDRMMYKLDRFSMYYGIEARSPMLDHRVVELAFKIPIKYNMSYKKTKLILKNILENDFNKKFIHRQKRGFYHPLEYWFKDANSKEMIHGLLYKNNIIYKYLDYDRVKNMLQQINNGGSSKSHKQLWRLVVLSEYLENFKTYLIVP